MNKEKEALISKAQDFSRKGQFPKAINAYTKALKLDSRDIRIIMNLAELYAKTNDPQAVQFYMLGASLLEHDGFYSRAIAALKQILEISSDNVEVLKSLHDLYGKLGLLVEAAECKEKLKALGVEIETPVQAKKPFKKKRRSRQQLKGGLVFKKQPGKNRSKKHRKSLKTVRKS